MTELIHTWQQKLRGSQRRATSESGERESPNAYFVSTWKRGSSKLWQSSARLAEAVVTRRVRALGQSPGEGRAFVGRALATIQRRENQCYGRALEWESVATIQRRENRCYGRTLEWAEHVVDQTFSFPEHVEGKVKVASRALSVEPLR